MPFSTPKQLLSKVFSSKDTSDSTNNSIAGTTTSKDSVISAGQGGSPQDALSYLMDGSNTYTYTATSGNAYYPSK